MTMRAFVKPTDQTPVIDQRLAPDVVTTPR